MYRKVRFGVLYSVRFQPSPAFAPSIHPVMSTISSVNKMPYVRLGKSGLKVRRPRFRSSNAPSNDDFTLRFFSRSI